jgi:hypothetical protein
MASSIVGIPEGEQRKFEKNRLFRGFWTFHNFFSISLINIILCFKLLGH